MFYYSLRLLKYLLGWIDLILLTIPLYLLSFLPPAWLTRFYPELFRRWCQFMIRAVNIELYLHQQNRYPLPARYILIANHPSAFEDVGIPALFKVYSLAKIEVKDWWIVGRMSVAAGTLFVQRESRTSRHAAAEAIIEALQQGKNVALYPEGGCKGRRIFESFRYGAFDISLRTGIPIVPVFLHYEAQEEFEWRDPQTLLHKIWHFMQATNPRANYYVFDAIDPKQFSNPADYCRQVHQLYLKWQQRYLE